jgi:hypothetical protein
MGSNQFLDVSGVGIVLADPLAINVADAGITALCLAGRQQATSRHLKPISEAISTTSSKVQPSKMAVSRPNFIIV